MPETEKTIVLGLGNMLCGDDGFGCHAVHMLKEKHTWPANCEIVDGGTQGQILYGIVSAADQLLLLDAVDFGKNPGEICLRRDGAIPTWLGSRKLSAHQSSFAEVLALAGLTGVLPQKMTLIGIQPQILAFGRAMSECCKKQIPKAIQLAYDELAQWGVLPEADSSKMSIITDELHRVFCPPEA